MIRNGQEYAVARSRKSELEDEIAARADLDRKPEEDVGVVQALTMQLDDIKRELAHYDMLDNGILRDLGATGIDGIGNLLVDARIAQGLTQEQLGAQLGMTQQQVQRYERDGYQKIALWRLAEVADALGIEVAAQAHLPDPVDLDERLARLSVDRAANPGR